LPFADDLAMTEDRDAVDRVRRRGEQEAAVCLPFGVLGERDVPATP
jgi:hypothetical protein